MTAALRSWFIGASLAPLLGLSPGCAPAPAGSSSSPGAGASSTTGEEGDSEDDASSVGVVSDGSLEPDPKQLAAGVPYLRFRVEVGDSPARGPADAPVTIVMFSDFECSFCDEAFHTIEELQAEYPEQIRFVYKALPLARHQNALEAALVGHSARAQGKFWEFHDLVFSGRGIDPETIEGYARQLGLDYDRITHELETLEYAPEVRRDLRVAKRLQLKSTPVFFINGRMLPGARPKRIFRHMIDQELDLAERLADEGVGAGELYDYATQWGYTAIVYEDAPPELDEDTVYPVPIGDSPTRGPADAPITIVAFSDFQCPFCARGHETMEELRVAYGEQIRFVFKHFPLPGHPLGALASRASFAAAEVGKFWEFHDAVFELGARYQGEDLVAILERLGVPRESIEIALTTGAHDARIEEDLDLGVRLEVSGTPAYFINGRPIVGAHPLMDFRMLIAEELERVEQARAKGVPPAKIYEHLTGAKD
jgi:protein-disulfide isomerase